MVQNKFSNTEKENILQQCEFKLMIFILVLSFSSIFGQAVTSVSPDSAAQGTSDLLVTFIISGDELPPSDAPVDQVAIGTIKGTSLTHNDTIITGIFIIPYGEEVGAKDVAVTFTPPPDQGAPIIFSLLGGFTVTEMGDIAPVIATQPKSKAIISGNRATLSITAYGPGSIQYEWLKDDAEINGAATDTYTIDSFTQNEVGSYKCIVTNDFGSITSEIAELTIDENNYEGTYPIVDTKQSFCYNDSVKIEYPNKGEDYYGQDSQYEGFQPSYTNNENGTITDNITGLIWAEEQSSETMSWNDASRYCESLTTGGYDDWRMPTVKELWSLRDFSTGWPWIDTTYFKLTGDGSQMNEHHSWTSNPYLVESEYQNEQVIDNPYWIVNDWTGHIKAMSGNRFVRAVRGNEYGINAFVDNEDSTVTDIATGLMWSQDDNGEHIYWKEALAYAESATLAGYDDWRLPNIKELQSIADYSVTEVPAMDKNVFNFTEVTNIVDQTIEQANYPFYWSSTSNPIETYEEAVDNDAEGDISGNIYAWILASGYNVDMIGYDLHGAGSVVFVSKTEENSGIEDSVPFMLRLVRDADGSATSVEDNEMGNLEIPTEYELLQNYPNPFNPSTQITVSIPESGMYTLRVYNILGQEVTTLLSDQINAGTYTFNFDASQLPAGRQRLTSGIYFYNFSGNNFSQTKKMLLMK